MPKASAAFENTYVVTGNQAEDLIGVAMTQVGYNEGPDNDTKYGDWMNIPNQAWCAIFISWCADQADIPTTVIQPSAWAHPRKSRGFNVPYYHGSEYTPKRGDLFFKEDFSHVGIVYGVEGEYALTIEANTNNDGSDEGYTVLLRKRKISESYFGVPQYRTCQEGHKYTIKYEPGHPHKRYYLCSTCKKAFYTGSTALVLSCRKCMSCSCSAGNTGCYQVSLSEGRLPVYTDHSAKKVLGYLDPGELVNLVAANVNWGHITYANSPGCVQMMYLKRFVHTPENLSADSSKYYHGDTAQITWDISPTASEYLITVMKDEAELITENTGAETDYTLEDLQPGSYEFLVQASDGTSLSEITSCNFQVLPTYTITMESTGGTGGVYEQIKPSDEIITLTTDIPQRSGYRLLGWNQDLRANYATWQPGDVWVENRDATLFAVWQKEDAVPSALQIFTPSTQTILKTGDTLDISEVVLWLAYSDGTAKLVTGGFTVENYDPYHLGTTEVALCYEGMRVSYTVLILPRLLEDLPHQWNYSMDDISF